MATEAAVQAQRTQLAYWRTYAARHKREDADAREEAVAMGHVQRAANEDAPRESAE